MEEQLISGLTNKLAKEKGFDNTIRHLVDYQREYVDPRGEGIGEYYSEKKWVRDYVHPTQSLLQKWLREVHGLNVLIYLSDKDCYIYHVWGKTGRDYDSYKTYEEALEVGLQEALKLI